MLLPFRSYSSGQRWVGSECKHEPPMSSPALRIQCTVIMEIGWIQDGIFDTRVFKDPNATFFKFELLFANGSGNKFLRFSGRTVLCKFDLNPTLHAWSESNYVASLVASWWGSTGFSSNWSWSYRIWFSMYLDDPDQIALHLNAWTILLSLINESSCRSARRQAVLHRSPGGSTNHQCAG